MADGVVAAQEVTMFDEATMTLATACGRQALLVLNLLHELGPGGAMNMISMAWIGMPEDKVHGRRNMSDLPLSQRQALAEEMATKIMAMPQWTGIATDTKELVAQSIRQMHQKATILNEQVKPDMPVVFKVSQCLVDFKIIYDVEFEREDRVWESVQEKVIEAVRVKHTVGWGKYTTIRKCHPYTAVNTSSLTKTFEVRPMKLDSGTQAIIAGDSEVCDNESMVLDDVMKLFHGWVMAHVLAAGNMAVPVGYDSRGVGMHKDTYLFLHLQQAKALLGSYTKLMKFEKDGNKIMIHMLNTVDFIRRLVEEGTPKLSLGAAMLEVFSRRIAFH